MAHPFEGEYTLTQAKRQADGRWAGVLESTEEEGKTVPISGISEDEYQWMRDCSAIQAIDHGGDLWVWAIKPDEKLRIFGAVLI